MKILNNAVLEQQEDERVKTVVRNYAKDSYNKAKSQIEKCPVCGSKHVKFRIDSGWNDYFVETFHIYGKCLDCESDFESDDFLMHPKANYSVVFNPGLNKFTPISSVKRESLKKKLSILSIILSSILFAALIIFAVSYPITDAATSVTNIWMLCLAFCFACVLVSWFAFIHFQYNASVDQKLAKTVQNIYEKLTNDAVSLIPGRSDEEDAIIKDIANSGYVFKTLLNLTLVDPEIRFYD